MSDDKRKEVPVTELRKKYKDLVKSTQAELDLEIARKTDPNELAEMFCQAVTHFSSYDNSEEGFIGDKRAKGEELVLPEGNASLKTIHVATCLKNMSDVISVNENSELGFVYVDREIVPGRTPDGKYEDDGESASSNFSADLLLRNATDDRPIIGEVKIGGDKNPYFALIQLLMHASEMVTASQVERLKIHYSGFKAEESVPGYDMYLILFEYEEHLKAGNEEIWSGLLQHTEEIANGLIQHEGFSKYIRQIVCLELPGVADVEGGFELIFKAARDS